MATPDMDMTKPGKNQVPSLSSSPETMRDRMAVKNGTTATITPTLVA